jgi:hypothetical protein
MRYLKVEVDEEEDWPPRRVRRVAPLLRRVRRPANPDLEEFFEHVRVWWVEIEDTGEASREIGFADTGEPIVLGPIGRNAGFHVDPRVDWNDHDGDSSEAGRRFEHVWQRLLPAFDHLE